MARYGGVPPYEETRNYVSRIMTLYTGRPYRMGGVYRPARPVKVVRDQRGAMVITNTPSDASGAARPGELSGGPLRGGFDAR